VIAVGLRQKEELERFRICPSRKIRSVPYGLDLRPFASSASLRGTFKRELGLSDSHVLVGIVARLVPIKGHRIFLEAARQVANGLEGVRFVVVGDGELRGALEAKTRELGLEEVVYFTGYRRDLPRIYASLDLVVLASFNEGLPIVLIEALAAGCYVVATDAGGTGDLIRNSGAGILVPPGDVGALARAMIEAIQGRISVSPSERDHVLYCYRAERLLDDVASLYSCLLDRM
jgi:glycosyltransferase involved in cell wall biosynthesis